MIALAALALLIAPPQAVAAVAPATTTNARRKRHRPNPPHVPTSGSWTIDGRISIASDYRPGGISSTNGKPALQADIAIQHRSGLFASAFASSLARNGGDRIELDLAGGYTRKAGGIDFSLLGTAYLFPGVSRSTYVEGQIDASKRIGTATLGGSIAYSPPQAGTDHRGNLYLGVTVDYDVPRSPWSFDAAFGRENGAFGNRKLDWSVGTTLALRPFELSLGYFDTARTFRARHSGRTLISSITLSF